MKVFYPQLSILMVVGSLFACDSTLDEDSHQRTAREIGTRVEASEFEDLFRIVGRIQLEENEAVLTVDPEVRVDSAGNLIVADRKEQQVRVYTERGTLLEAFGQAGPGPAEFSSPNVATSLGNGSILVVDSHRKALVWDTAASEPERILSYDLYSVDDADILPDGKLLYSGRAVLEGRSSATRALHIVDPDNGELQHSFFVPPSTPATARVTALAGWTQSDVLGEAIASVFALADTVYLHTLSGAEGPRFALPTSHFTSIAEPPPADAPVGPWLLGHSFASSVHWISRDLLVVQYQDFEQNVPRWRLLAMNLEGDAVWEVLDSPRLYAIDRDRRRFYFDDPDQVTPDRLLVGVLDHE